ncbi:hypothetical protein BDA96_09G080100 [Sorghum bicolor]|uniref:Uncharacterized protein n=2 Tax=Sorghum bicolor TaxID=4558 RepID=A0A921U3W6_SORBI|nr:hypothetical protein BDA96_09G080100 [Sorghum bicolor]KXG21525.1 hypothetical protein SORBI_3009G076100 [Sorghum bicolor]
MSSLTVAVRAFAGSSVSPSTEGGARAWLGEAARRRRRLRCSCPRPTPVSPSRYGGAAEGLQHGLLRDPHRLRQT